MSETPDPDTREARRARQRPPESYDTVSEWFADYRGFVPLQMAHAFSRLTAAGMSFPDAYRALRDQGRIIEIDPAETPEPEARLGEAQIP